MSERVHWEKEAGQDEKQEEKQEEKHDEKQEEKGHGEKLARDPVGAVVWATILIWAGLVFLADSLGLWGQLLAFPTLAPWPAVLAGAGLIVIGGAFFRLLVPEHSRPVTGAFVVGAVLIALGVGSAIGYELALPLVLIGVGALILLRNLLPRR